MRNNHFGRGRTSRGCFVAASAATIALSVLITGCGGGSASKSNDSGTSVATSGETTITATPAGINPVVASAAYTLPAGLSFNSVPLAAVPNRTTPNWGAEEAPVGWNYTAEYPSRSACAAGEGATFEVGPGRAYAELRDVPWLKLLPCDQVNVFYRPAPYKDIVYLGARGAKDKWITLRGIPGAAGELPILDGDGAVMPVGTGANTWSDIAGMIIIKRPDAPEAMLSANYKPGYLHITGLHIRNARPPQSVTNLAGNVVQWNAFTGGIYVNGAEKVAITYCELADNGLGIFANSTNGEMLQTRNLLVARNYIHGNGNPYNFSTHNAYSEGIATVYEFNYFGEPTANSYGDNIKERSTGIVFRYNYVESGSNLLSLRDAQSNFDNEKDQVDSFGERMNDSAFVYANTWVTRKYPDAILSHGDGNSASNGVPSQVRRGAVYFHGNRVVTMVDNQGYWENNAYYDTQGVSMFHLWNVAQTTVSAVNNLFYSTSLTQGATPAPLALFEWQGWADFKSNWANNFMLYRIGAGPGYSSSLPVGVPFDGTGIGGLTASASDPGFVDIAASNFATTQASPFASLTGALATAVTKRGLVPVADPVARPFTSN